MALIYKSICQVHILHEFYLTDPDGKTVFEGLTQIDRTNYVLKEYTLGNSSINEDLDFQFPPDFRNQYEDYGLRVLPTYSGFRIVAQVDKLKMSDGSVRFKPVQPFPAEFRIWVQVLKKNLSTDRYSWSPFFGETSFNYFLSNGKLNGARTFPYLNLNSPMYDPGRSYEQGEVAEFGTGDNRQFYLGGGGETWEKIPGTSFLSRNDRILASSRFQFSFINMPSASAAEFVIRDLEGNEIQVISLSSISPNRKVTLDFTNIADRSAGSAEPLYTLLCRGNNGQQYSQTVLFRDELYNPINWAVVELQTLPDDNRYRLLDPEGYILKRMEADGTWVDAPIFEIPVKSRFPFWRFRNNHGRELDLPPALQPFLLKEQDVLITQKPAAMTRQYFLVSDLSGTMKKYLPNPVDSSLIMDEKKRLCYEIRVPESVMFPVIP